MKNYALSMLALLTLLSGCASAPSVCQSLPDKPVKVPLVQNWQQEMQNFLAGTLPEQQSKKQP